MTDEPSTELAAVPDELATQFPQGASDELARIRLALMQGMNAVATIEDTPTAAVQWLAVDIIARDLAVFKKELATRLINLAPTKDYKYTPKGGVQEVRTRPVKEQVITGLGTVLIETSSNREWNDRRALAQQMIGDLANGYAIEHEGELPRHNIVVGWLFDLFTVGDPRVTKMDEYGLKSYDNDDNCTKNPTTSARVRA